MAARRDGLGEPPTPEELLAYRDGLLESEQRQRIADKIACHPDAARALSDLLAFPDVEAAPGTPKRTEAEIDARWQAFRQRLPERPSAEALEGSVRPITFPRSPTSPPLRRRRPILHLAAAVLLGLGVGWAVGYSVNVRRDPVEPSINVQIAELAPVGEASLRSTSSPVERLESAEELVLVLGGRANTEKELPNYEVEWADPQGGRVVSRQGLHPTPLGTFSLSFARGALPPGRYRFDLFGRDRGSRVHLATYELRLSDRGETR